MQALNLSKCDSLPSFAHTSFCVNQRLLISSFRQKDDIWLILSGKISHQTLTGLHITLKLVISKSNLSLKNVLTLVFPSRRGPEFWPGSRHRDRRSVGSGHRHRGGDCCCEEDGKILVSTSSLMVVTHTAWIHVNAGSYTDVVQWVITSGVL